MNPKNIVAPQFLVLDLFKKKPELTPEEIDQRVGRGPYASKYVCFLKALGHNIDTVKDGRKVLRYVYGGSRLLPLGLPTPSVHKRPKKATNKKPRKPKAPKAPVELTEEQIRAKNLALMRKILLKNKPKKVAKPRRDMYGDIVEQEFGTSGEIAKSYNIDKDWDSVEGLDIQELIV